MKKKIIRASALLLAAVMLFALVGCSSLADAGKKFTRGTVSGNVYHSDFAELTFTAPEDWYFYSDEEIAAVLGTSAELMSDPEAFEKATESEAIDFIAVAPDGTTNVGLSFTKGNVLTDLDASLVKSTDTLTEQYGQMGFSCTVKEPVERKLGNQTFKVAEFSVDLGNATMTQYFYMAKIGIYLATATVTCTDGTAAATFEAMFS